MKSNFCAYVLLISAGVNADVAYGQSQAGWVLWERIRQVEKVAAAPLTETVEWEPREGYEDLRSCRIAAVAQARSVVAQHEAIEKEFGQELRKERGGTFEAKMLGETEAVVIGSFTDREPKALQTTNHRFVCFPGGTDPRPRPTVRPAADAPR